MRIFAQANDIQDTLVYTVQEAEAPQIEEEDDERSIQLQDNPSLSILDQPRVRVASNQLLAHPRPAIVGQFGGFDGQNERSRWQGSSIVACSLCLRQHIP